MTKNYKDIVLNSLPGRELEIVGEITAERMSSVRQKAIEKLRTWVEVDGFRKGNAPETLVVQKVGEMRILEESAEIALGEEYPNILEEHKVDAIGRPEINITKIGVGSPLAFKIKTFLAPEIKLADYKKIAKAENGKEKKVVEVTEKEVDDVILDIRHSIAHEKVHKESSSSPDVHDHREIRDADLPEVNDEFAKSIGNFANVEEMREKIKENIGKEKEIKEKDKKRTSILEAIIEKSTIELPKIIIEGEQEKMLAQLKDDLARAGVNYEDYLKHIKKSEDDLRKEWEETATKRAKSQMTLNTIAKEENITPDEEELKKEMEHILSHHKDADRFRVRMYVETFMTNELVLKWLEEQK
jgi:trigger factor